TRLRALLPGIAVTASHEISRQWREYERSNTAVLSAYVQPVMRRYRANLSDALADQAIDCPYYCMQSNGGLAEFEAAERAPLVLVESGPAGGCDRRRARRRSPRRDGDSLSRRWRHDGKVFADPQRPAGIAAGLQARMEPH